MLLIISCIIAFVIFDALAYITIGKDWIIGEIFSIVGTILILLYLIYNICLIGDAFINKNAHEATWRAEYEAIVTQIDNHAYSILDRNDLIVRATEWNKTLANGQAKHNSLWTNWMYLEDYDSFEMIDVGKIK